MSITDPGWLSLYTTPALCLWLVSQILIQFNAILNCWNCHSTLQHLRLRSHSSAPPQARSSVLRTAREALTAGRVESPRVVLLGASRVVVGRVLRQRQEPLVHLLLAVLIEHARQLLLHAFGAFAPAPLDRERILYKGVSTDALQVVCRSTHTANSTHRRDSVTGTAPFAPPPTAWGATVSRVARRSAALRHSPRPLQLGAVQRHDLFAGSNWLPLWGTATLYSCTCAFAVTLVQPHPTGPQSIATGGCPTTL